MTHLCNIILDIVAQKCYNQDIRLRADSPKKQEDNIMKIEFTDREYRFEHGHAPKGRGWWFFKFEGHEFEATGTLTEAKKKCREHIREIAPKDYVGTVYVNIEP